MNDAVGEELVRRFSAHFGLAPAVVAHAPGRVEVLGNHTDYNEGYVLSAAINRGTFFAAAPAEGRSGRVVAADVREEAAFDLDAVGAVRRPVWANYVKGVVAGLRKRAAPDVGFLGMFLGDIPLGAGLSSSAALEISAGLALCRLWGLAVPPLELARIGQAAEHDYVGVKCGLLDQISSLHGRDDALVMSDFRTLAVRNVPLGHGATFLVCNTAVKHALVESEYNERRARCEEAARDFARVLPHPVAALRDVSLEEWRAHAGRMDPVTARRAAHIVGENARVLEGCDRLAQGDLAAFGRLMFDSHESSRTQFENSCGELDALVSAARRHGRVLGARLSGGGFGGSAVMLVRVGEAAAVAADMAAAYTRAFGHPCATLEIRPSAGARVVAP